MGASTFRKLRTYTRYSHLQACGFYAPIPFSKLAANMRFHYYLPSLRPTCATTSPQLAADTRHHHLPSAPLSKANMRQHHLSSARPTCAGLPCNILLRRLPSRCTRPTQATPPCAHVQRRPPTRTSNDERGFFNLSLSDFNLSLSDSQPFTF
jgi:hypothetical protein